MIAYKLFRKRKDGTLGPLFINRKQRIPRGEWLSAEDHPTTGYARRPGWHCAMMPCAPHLSMNDSRVWCMVSIRNPHLYKRPSVQGGMWAIAPEMKVLAELSEKEVYDINHDTFNNDQ